MILKKHLLAVNELPPTLRRLSPDETPDRLPELAALTVAVVHAGASVSFLAPLSQERASAFWAHTAAQEARGGAHLFVAERQGPVPRIVGTTLLVTELPENQPHRADLAKVMVHPEARRAGLAAALVSAAEAHAHALGKTLLVLDTVTGSPAERLYQRLGWQRVGTIPHYALMPDGTPCDTTYYYKRLG